MENLLKDRGFFVKTDSFLEVETMRMDFVDKISEKKEELSHQKCALLLNDLIYSSKLNIPLFEYVKEKYGVKLDFVEKGRVYSIDEIKEYIFNVFSSISDKVSKDRDKFSFDILDDFDLSCLIHFYPIESGIAFIVETRQEQYIDIFKDHIQIEDYSFDVFRESPPPDVSFSEWAHRAKTWLSVINKCGGNEDWLPSAGGFTVDLTKSSFFMPDFESVDYYLKKMKNNDLEDLLENMINKVAV